jgi:hypothetical protein
MRKTAVRLAFKRALSLRFALPADLIIDLIPFLVTFFVGATVDWAVNPA